MTDVVCILDVLSFTNLINHLNHQEELPVNDMPGMCVCQLGLIETWFKQNQIL